MSNAAAVRVIRAVCIVCFVGGIAGMIVASLADNNIGAVLTAGIISAIAAIVLLAVSTVVAQRRLAERPDRYHQHLPRAKTSMAVEFGTKLQIG